MAGSTFVSQEYSKPTSGRQRPSKRSGNSPFADNYSTSSYGRQSPGLSFPSRSGGKSDAASPYSGGFEQSADQPSAADTSATQSEATATAGSGRRAPKLLEAKWKMPSVRSPMCEGCGQGMCPPAGTNGSKSWKCGPCVRSLEASYLRALENLEKEYEIKLQKNLAVGVRNFQLQEEMQKRGYEIEKLTLLLHEAESKLTAGDALVQQLAAQLSDGRMQHRRMVELQNEIMTDNSRLHGSAQTAGTELERTSHIVRDLEHANQVLRDENQALSDRVRALLDAVAGLREELRASFHGQESAAAQATAERREWREAQRALETEADDLRRRLRWLEEGTTARPAAGPPAHALSGPARR